MRESTGKKRIRVVHIVLLICAVLLLAFLAWFLFPILNIPYSKERWVAYKTYERIITVTDRQRMTDDLIKNHLKVGMSKEQIMALLGKPSLVWEYKEDRSFEYYVGPGLIDSLLLVIIFNDNWKFKEAHVVEG